MRFSGSTVVHGEGEERDEDVSQITIIGFLFPLFRGEKCVVDL